MAGFRLPIETHVLQALGRTHDPANVERAVALDERAPELRNELGRAYLAVGRVVDAQRAFEQALALDPQSAAARANLALARQRGAGRR